MKSKVIYGKAWLRKVVGVLTLALHPAQPNATLLFDCTDGFKKPEERPKNPAD